MRPPSPFIAWAGQPFRPSNGTEMMGFHDGNCAHCRRETTSQSERAWPRCRLLSAAFLNEAPAEWIYDDQGYPTCTAFAARRPPAGAKPYRCPHTLDLFEAHP